MAIEKYLNGNEPTETWLNNRVDDVQGELKKQEDRFKAVAGNLNGENLARFERAYFHPLVQELASAKENSAYHSESSVLGHTMDVVEGVAYTKHGDLYVASLFHDVGKIVTMAEKNGNTQAIKHDHMGKEILTGMPDELSLLCENPEEVVALVGFHMEPLNLYNNIQNAKKPEKTMRKAFNKWGEYKDNLLILSEADVAHTEKAAEISAFYATLKEI